eukprot:1921421-Alexandrium_andersonii.AAC.1
MDPPRELGKAPGSSSSAGASAVLPETNSSMTWLEPFRGSERRLGGVQGSAPAVAATSCGRPSA